MYVPVIATRFYLKSQYSVDISEHRFSEWKVLIEPERWSSVSVDWSLTSREAHGSGSLANPCETGGRKRQGR